MEEQNPTHGGSYIRNADGTLTRQENAPVNAQQPVQPVPAPKDAGTK